MAKIRSHISGGKDSIGATCWIPALLTSTSTRPNFASAKPHEASHGFRIGHVGW